MTKSKFVLSTLGVLAAAGAVFASVLMNKKGKIKIKGEMEKKDGGMTGARGAGASVRGSVDATRRT